jgi:adenylyltransferase/sulfurtransferase
MPELTERYSRQIHFPDIGPEGQARLAASRVVVAGCGALGTVQADLLCRAGVGHLRIIDRDFIEESNLQRQSLFSEQDLADNLPKAVAAQRRLQAVNSSVQVEGIVADLNHRTIEALVGQPDCILDATDNFEARYLVNDYALKFSIPWIYGAAVSSYGMTMTILPRQTPCLRCVFETMPPPGSAPTCDTVGVLAPLVNVIASLQVSEALKILCGHLEKINRGLTQIDIWQCSWRSLDMSRVYLPGHCPACGKGQLEYLEGKGDAAAVVLCGRNTIQVTPPISAQLNFYDLAARLASQGEVHHNEYLLRFSTSTIQMTLFPDGRALLKGVQDPAQARSLYARLIGL